MSESVIQTIREDIDSYPRGSRAVATAILDQPEKVLYMSINELAQVADVSDPTVLRFARKLGFEGYKEFKQGLAEDITVPASTSAGSVADVLKGGEGFLHRISSAFDVNFEMAIDAIDEDTFSRAVDALSGARSIQFWGQCTSSSLAMDAYTKFFNAGIPCEVFTEPDKQKLYSRQLGDKDVVVAISHLGQNYDLAESIGQARELGAVVIGITTESSPVAEASSLVLGTSERMRDDVLASLSLKIVQLFLVDALATAVYIAKNGDASGLI